MTQINKINFDDPDALRHRISFDSLTPLYPDEKLKLEMDGGAAVMAPSSRKKRAAPASPPRRVSSRRTTGTLTEEGDQHAAAAARHIDPRTFVVVYLTAASMRSMY